MRRKLGKSGLEVSALGLGCWAIGGAFWENDNALGWGEINDDDVKKAIRAGLDYGINFFDTADVYGAGRSEKIIGESLKENRKEVVIATKFGIMFDENTKEVLGTNAEDKYIVKACEDSLRRLNTDYIDLYQFHLNDYDPKDAIKVKYVLENLVKEGKIRTYGWSTDFVERAKVFARGKNCSAIQHQLNVIDDNSDMIEYCESNELTSINRGPLAMGLLTGKYNLDSSFSSNDVRGVNSPDWMQYFNKGVPNNEGLKKINAIRDILTSNGRTLAQGALAWIWGRSNSTIPIPGFKTVKQVEENCKAIELGALTGDQINEIELILGRGNI